MFKLAFIVAALLPLCLAQSNPGQACAGGLPPPSNVLVEGCSAAPCDVTDGGTYNFVMDFTMGTASTQLTNRARVFVAGADIGFELPAAVRDACASDGISCPVAAGTSISSAMSVTISAPVTGVLAEIQYEMVNENGVVVVCWASTINVLA